MVGGIGLGGPVGGGPDGGIGSFGLGGIGSFGLGGIGSDGRFGSVVIETLLGRFVSRAGSGTKQSHAHGRSA